GDLARHLVLPVEPDALVDLVAVDGERAGQLVEQADLDGLLRALREGCRGHQEEGEDEEPGAADPQVGPPARSSWARPAYGAGESCVNHASPAARVASRGGPRSRSGTVLSKRRDSTHR